MRAEDPVEKILAYRTNSVHPAVPNSGTLIDTSVTVYLIHVDLGYPIVLGEDHISRYTTFQGPDILRKVIFWDMFHSTKSTHFS